MYLSTTSDRATCRRLAPGTRRASSRERRIYAYDFGRRRTRQHQAWLSASPRGQAQQARRPSTQTSKHLAAQPSSASERQDKEADCGPHPGMDSIAYRWYRSGESLLSLASTHSLVQWAVLRWLRTMGSDRERLASAGCCYRHRARTDLRQRSPRARSIHMRWRTPPPVGGFGHQWWALRYDGCQLGSNEHFTVSDRGLPTVSADATVSACLDALHAKAPYARCETDRARAGSLCRTFRGARVTQNSQHISILSSLVASSPLQCSATRTLGILRAERARGDRLGPAHL